MKVIIIFNDGSIKVSESVTDLEDGRRGLLLYDDEHNDQRPDDGTLSGRGGPLVLENVAKIEVIP